jgi:HAE1 family hydrophobic/amphiphilic exporter-1
VPLRAERCASTTLGHRRGDALRGRTPPRRWGVKGTLDEQSIRPWAASNSQIREHRPEERLEIVRLGRWRRSRWLRRARRLQPEERHPNVGLSVTARATRQSLSRQDPRQVVEINKTLPKGTKLEVTQDGGKDAE